MKRPFVVLLILLALLSAACTYDIRQYLPVRAAVSSPDAMHGDPVRGSDIFHHGVNGSPPCSTCHLTAQGMTGFSLGPNLAGVGERAATREDGVSALDYIRESILDPYAFITPGYRNIMYPDFASHFDDQDLDDLIAYLLSL
ncbi:MAG: cytochrome c [Anaerolineae bacterium]|nr:cytochrome c [Anaerolineae bacterium]